MAIRMFKDHKPDLALLSAPDDYAPATAEEIGAKRRAVVDAFDTLLLARRAGDRERVKGLFTAAFAELSATEQFCTDQATAAEQAGDLALLERIMPLVTKCAELRSDMRFYSFDGR